MIRQTLGVLGFSIVASSTAVAQSPAAPRSASLAPEVTIVSTQETSLLTRLGAVPGRSVPQPIGITWYWFEDPNCPNSPDTFNAWVEYWDGSTFYADFNAGNQAYDCSNGFHPASFPSSYYYQQCTSHMGFCDTLGWSWTPHSLQQVLSDDVKLKGR
jgi:hypothetical protein